MRRQWLLGATYAATAADVAGELWTLDHLPAAPWRGTPGMGRGGMADPPASFLCRSGIIQAMTRWLVLALLILVLPVAAAAGGDDAAAPPPPLPEGDAGIAAEYPGDDGIGKDPAVLFHDDFESGEPRDKWDEAYHAATLRLAREPENVHGGRRALEFTVPKQAAELSNSVVKHFERGQDVVFLRYYSKFEKDFDQTGSSHNGGFLAARAEGVPYATPEVRADGRNKFMASLENWRGEAAEPPPGGLNVYCYHPGQRSEFGDHFFPSGKVLPFSFRPGDFGPRFTPRKDVVPERGRWYCYELMLRANTPGRRDGRIACWLDGKLLADFPNLRLRDVETLKVNSAALDLHIGSNTIRENKKWYDDVVVATAYVGPVKKRK